MTAIPDSTPRRLAAACGFSLILLALTSTPPPTAFAGETPAPPTIAELRQDQVDTLRKLVEVVTAQYNQGAAGHTDVIAAQNQLLQARLNATSDSKTRLTLRAELVDNLKGFEKLVQSRFDSGAAPINDVLGARAARLKAEIALRHERKNINAP